MKIANTVAGLMLAEWLGGVGLDRSGSTSRPGRPSTFLKPFDPKINRHTGKPHEHRREIARRARCAA